MANEHVLMLQKTFPISMTCANGTGIEKGSVLALADPNTAALSIAADDPVAGIAYTEKIANDGNTQIAVLTGPGDELKGIASGSISIGNPLVTAVGPTNNYLSAGAISGSSTIGYSKENASAGETFKYILSIGVK